MATSAWQLRLRHRLSKARERCELPHIKQYCDYGGRGIQFNFVSVAEAVDYCINTLGLTESILDSTTLDRTDNSGHYEPGNIRFIPHTDNNTNRRDSIHWSHGQVLVPNRDAYHVVRYLWPEVTYSQNSYRYMYNQYALRTLQDVKDWHDNKAGAHSGAGARKKILPPVDRSVVAKYLEVH